jgi:hypothetical protein
MNPDKSPISGRQITHKEALKGLGNPKKWKPESDAVYVEFRAKPAHLKETLLKKATGTFQNALAKSKPELEPVYAKKTKRQSAAKRKTRKLRTRNR